MAVSRMLRAPPSPQQGKNNNKTNKQANKRLLANTISPQCGHKGINSLWRTCYPRWDALPKPTSRNTYLPTYLPAYLPAYLPGHGCASRLVFSEPSLSKALGVCSFCSQRGRRQHAKLLCSANCLTICNCPQQSIGRSSPQTLSPRELVSSLLQMNINIRIIVTSTFAVAGARKLSRLPFTINRLSSMSLGQLETSDIIYVSEFFSLVAHLMKVPHFRDASCLWPTQCTIRMNAKNTRFADTIQQATGLYIFPGLNWARVSTHPYRAVKRTEGTEGSHPPTPPPHPQLDTLALSRWGEK